MDRAPRSTECVIAAGSAVRRLRTRLRHRSWRGLLAGVLAVLALGVCAASAPAVVVETGADKPLSYAPLASAPTAGPAGGQCCTGGESRRISGSGGTQADRPGKGDQGGETCDVLLSLPLWR